MARYRGSRCRLCRRAQVKLFLKGSRCISERCSIDRRPYPPGPQRSGATTRPVKPSVYNLQLREKQKLKQIYGLLERQFRRFYEVSQRKKGLVIDNLVVLLERRLDNVVYRCSFAVTRAQARQFVSHGHIKVNGKKLDRPSYLVKENDIIEIKEKIKSSTQTDQKIPSWLAVEGNEAKILRLPTREDAGVVIEDELIISFYSK